MMNVVLNMPILYFCLLQTVFMLLKSKSEQERRLLTALVNKVSYLSFSTFSTPFYLFLFLKKISRYAELL